jgi:Spy/CpxP family protein refolding chaperone
VRFCLDPRGCLSHVNKALSGRNCVFVLLCVWVWVGTCIVKRVLVSSNCIPTAIVVAACFLLVFVSCCAQRGMDSLDPTDALASRTLSWVQANGRNLRSEFDIESGSDDSASAPEGAQRSRQNTTESSELPEDAASFVMYKRMQAMMEAQIKKLRQEAREERYRLEEVIKEEKAKIDALKLDALRFGLCKPTIRRRKSRLMHCVIRHDLLNAGVGDAEL